MTCYDFFMIYIFVFVICYICIHIFIIRQRQLCKARTEPMLMQISKGKTLSWHIYLFEIFWSSLSSWERWLWTYIVKNICTKIQKTTYGTHIYLIRVLCGHIIWCHNCWYHILVHIQIGDTATDKEKRLVECVRNARDAKEKAEEENDSVMSKARDLKWWLVPGVEMTHEELEHLVHDIENIRRAWSKHSSKCNQLHQHLWLHTQQQRKF